MTIALLAAVMAVVSGCGLTRTKSYNTGWPDGSGSYSVNGDRYQVMNTGKGYYQEGQASWYGRKFHGRKTASGERYNMHKMTAAHKTLPLHTWAVVKNLENGRQAVVKINDRGPFHETRIIDLSHAAAKKLDMKGLCRVSVKAVTEAEAHQIMKAGGMSSKL